MSRILSHTRLALATLLLPLINSLLLISLFNPSYANAGEISVYWGQDSDEGGIYDACATGNYQIVMVSFLKKFGGGQTPELDLDSHCDPQLHGCTYLGSQVEYCQEQNITVLLSLGGPKGNYSLSSDEDAVQVAEYLWMNYLGGTSTDRPLGDAILDGIDFDIEEDGSGQYYDILASTLKGYNPDIILSGAPVCTLPIDYNFNQLIRSGLLNYVWVKFYNNTRCQYDGTVSHVLNAWDLWTKCAVPSNQTLFMGLLASSDAEPSGGFIPSDKLINFILPHLKNTTNYGGVMLWNRHYDAINANKYSRAIKGHALKQAWEQY